MSMFDVVFFLLGLGPEMVPEVRSQAFPLSTVDAYNFRVPGRSPNARPQIYGEEHINEQSNARPVIASLHVHTNYPQRSGKL